MADAVRRLEFRFRFDDTVTSAVRDAFVAAGATWGTYLTGRLGSQDAVHVHVRRAERPLEPRGTVAATANTWANLSSYERLRDLMRRYAISRDVPAPPTRLLGAPESTATRGLAGALPLGLLRCLTGLRSEDVVRAGWDATGGTCDDAVVHVDGSAAGVVDWTSVALHELGHVLGFVSCVDDVVGASEVRYVTPLDTYRFAPEDMPRSVDEFERRPRALQTARNPREPRIFCDLGAAYPLSPGVSGPTQVAQACHWFGHVGIMDACVDVTRSSSEPPGVSVADLRALRAVGYGLTAVGRAQVHAGDGEGDGILNRCGYLVE
jgi:hypothetical protein